MAAPSGRRLADQSRAELLPAALGDQLARWDAALLHGEARPVQVHLRPWFRDRDLRRRVQTPQDAVKAADAAGPGGAPASRAQAAAWLRRPKARAGQNTDPTIPLDTGSRAYVYVFGSTEDDTVPQNVTPLPRPDPREER